MSDFKMDQLQNVITELNLQDDDILYNIKMPDALCKVCGGNGVSEWDGQTSVLCDCLISMDTEREHMPFGVLLKLHNLTKKEVYDE